MQLIVDLNCGPSPVSGVKGNELMASISGQSLYLAADASNANDKSGFIVKYAIITDAKKTNKADNNMHGTQDCLTLYRSYCRLTKSENVLRIENGLRG